MDSFTFNALYMMHQNYWTDDLLGLSFKFIHDCVLNKAERLILGYKVEFYENGMTEDEANREIATILHVNLTRVTRALRDIKMKYRRGFDSRVDNKLHPEIYRMKKRKGTAI